LFVMMGRMLPSVPSAGEALEQYARSISYDIGFHDRLLGPPWRKAYEHAGKPQGILSAKEGYELASLHQRELKNEMRRVCSPFTSADLCFAVRVWTPGLIDSLGLSFGEEDPSVDPMVFAMLLRRIATSAALLYGRPFPETQATVVGGMVPPGDLGRFARAFVALMTLSHAYFFSGWGLKIFCSMGYGLRVDASSMQLLDEDEEDQDILTYSNDNRKRGLNYSLVSRIGEFDEHPIGILDPREKSGKEELGDRAAIITAWYERDTRKMPGYRLRAELLEPVEKLLMELGDAAPDIAHNAWGMSFPEFVALLGGFSEMVKNRSADDGMARLAVPGATGMAEHMFKTCTLFLFDYELEGDGQGSLLRRAEEYAKEEGLGPYGMNLTGARNRFLDLTTSTGKQEVEDDSGDPLGISLGDGRYSWLMHKFGRTYIVDFFHADHWLNRPLDILSGHVRGDDARLKGLRVEDKVWEYMERSDTVEAANQLRGAEVRRIGRSEQLNDLDCPLRFGDTLILAEVKGKYIGRAPESFARPEIVRRRWEENRRFLAKVDETAVTLAARRKDATFREAMTGVRHILPVVLRPYPEWVPDLDDEHWLRKPTRTDVGVPRVLTPQELVEFLRSTTEEEIAVLPGSFVVKV
jgi:hypothetical protein